MSKQSYVTLLILSVVTLMLIAACSGPEGDKGSQGAQGAQGAQGTDGTTGMKGSQGSEGSQGTQGPPGARGPEGTTGAQGPKGNQGAQGATGPLVPASIIATAKGSTSGEQPVAVQLSKTAPEIIVYGSGFPAGDIIVVTLITNDGEFFLQQRGGSEVVSKQGTFQTEWRTNTKRKAHAYVPGLYTIMASAGPSGIQASAPLIISAPKE